MPDKKYKVWVPGLPNAATLDGTELIAIVQSGSTVKSTLTNLFSKITLDTVLNNGPSSNIQIKSSNSKSVISFDGTNTFISFTGTSSSNQITAQENEIGGFSSDLSGNYGSLAISPGESRVGSILGNGSGRGDIVVTGSYTAIRNTSNSGATVHQILVTPYDMEFDAPTYVFNQASPSTIGYFDSSKNLIGLTIGSGLSLTGTTLSATGGGSNSLNSGFIFVGNSSNIATGVALNQLNYKQTFIPNSNAVAITPGTDPTNRVTVTAWSQSSGSGTSYGDGVRFIAEHGRTKLGLKFFARGDSAKVISANFAPFNVTNGQQLVVVVDGGAPQTITFSGLAVSGAATADEIANQISAVITGAQAINLISGNNNPIQISSDTFGILSTIQVTGGSANTGLGFSTTQQVGVGGVALGDGQTGLQKGWVVCHDKPNDLTSANRHGHMSFEVTDSTGAMQTRLGFEYDLDNTRATFSSCQVIVNENPIILGGSTGSNKELWFSFDNSGQQKSRLILLRCAATTGNLNFVVVNDLGVTDTVMILDRLNSRVLADASFQLKKGSSVARSTTLSPLASGGNSFDVTGTGTATYMKIDTWQVSSRIILNIPSGVVLAHNGASPSPGVSVPFFLTGAVNYTVGASGCKIEFEYDGTYWQELWRKDFAASVTISRLIFSAQSGSVSLGSNQATDYVYIFTASGTATLPTAVGNTNRYTIKQSGSGILTVNTTSSQTIDGSLTALLSSPQSIDVVSNGANWIII